MPPQAYHFPQGAKVRIGLRYAAHSPHPRWGRTTTRYVEQPLWRDVPPNSAIGFDEPRSHRKATSCAASVTFAPKVNFNKATLPKRGPFKIR